MYPYCYYHASRHQYHEDNHGEEAVEEEEGHLPVSHLWRSNALGSMFHWRFFSFLRALFVILVISQKSYSLPSTVPLRPRSPLRYFQ